MSSNSKAELSYSYWTSKAATEAPPPEPKKLTAEEVAAQQQQLRHTTSGASAWNAAGTLEERPVPLPWVRQQLEQLLGGLRHSQQGVQVTVSGLTACSGEAHQWVVRGKKRAGFELQLEFEWLARLSDGAVVAGTAKVPQAAADELDELQLEVPADGGASGGGTAQAPSAEQRRQAQAAVRSMLPALEQALRQLAERLRQR